MPPRIVPEDVDVLLEVVSGLSLKDHPEKVEALVRRTTVLPSVNEPTGIRVDFILSFTPYESEVIGRGRSVPIGGRKIRYSPP